MSKSDQDSNKASVLTPEQEIYSVEELLKIKGEQQRWIVKELLPRDGQILLSGPPKTGKSYIATDLAISLSRPFRDATEKRYLFAPAPLGDKIISIPASTKDAKSTDLALASSSLQFEIERPDEGQNRGWRVLFFSLEMSRGVVTLRYREQLTGHGLLVSKPEAQSNQDLQIPADQIPELHTSFGIKIQPEDGEVALKKTKKNISPIEDPNKIHQDLKLLEVKEKYGESPVFEETKFFKKIKTLIGTLKPEVVIYDSLIQLHEFEENDNIKMKRLLRALRDLNSITYSKDYKVNVAHLVIHHNRKELGGRWSELSADSMRGAGAIHAVADLAMMVRLLPTGKPGSSSKVIPGVGPLDSLVEVHISSRNSSIGNFALCRKAQVHIHTIVSLSDIKAAQKVAKKKDKKKQKPDGTPIAKLKQVAFNSVYPEIMKSTLTKLNGARFPKDRETIVEQAYSTIADAMKTTPGVNSVGIGFVRKKAKELADALEQRQQVPKKEVRTVRNANAKNSKK